MFHPEILILKATDKVKSNGKTQAIYKVKYKFTANPAISCSLTLLSTFIFTFLKEY